MAGADDTAAGQPKLRRVLTFPVLVLYGLGVIVGAGIYVAIGAVTQRAGDAAPMSFLLAGVAAGLTGLCYAELAARFPEASAGVAYVRHGFGADWLARLTGLAITLAVAVSAASIAVGAAHYLTVLLPVPSGVVVAGLILGFTCIAMLGVRESVGVAAAMSAIELAGLLAAALAGLLAAPTFHLGGMLPIGVAAWRGTAAGAFIAFFSFIGFETLANLAEEVRDPRRTLPRGIIAAVSISTVLYVAVATAVVLADSTTGNPLLALFEGTSASVFAAVGSIAVANGVLVQIIMLARLLYGMAARGQLPQGLAKVHPRARTPIPATALSGAIILGMALIVPFEHLLVFSNAVTLVVFVLVDLALWRLQHREPVTSGHFAAPRWVPPAAALLALALILGEFLG